MRIGVVPDPHNWAHWNEAQALLEPARARGDFPSVLDDDELLWAVMDGDELLACATAWLSNQGYAEVALVGGRDHPRWLAELDRRIGAAAKEAGATRMVAFGRRGWAKSLKRLGWDSQDMGGGDTAYHRPLE